MNRVYRVPNPGASNPQPPKLPDRMRQVLRTKHYAFSAEENNFGVVAKSSFPRRRGSRERDNKLVSRLRGNDGTPKLFFHRC